MKHYAVPFIAENLMRTKSAIVSMDRLITRTAIMAKQNLSIANFTLIVSSLWTYVIAKTATRRAFRAASAVRYQLLP